MADSKAGAVEQMTQLLTLHDKGFKLPFRQNKFIN